MNQPVDSLYQAYTYVQAFCIYCHCKWITETWCISQYGVTSWTSVLCTVKGDRPRQGGEKVVIGQFGDSFLKVMDREAATRMSGRHQTNPLANEGPCPVHWGELRTSWPDGEWNKFKISLVILFYKDLKDQDHWVPCNIIIN